MAAVNAMVPGEETALEELLGRIHDADARDLKRMFLERLTDNARNQRGGAGLGLIEMARRSGHNLRHRIVQEPGGTALFFLEVVLGDAMEEDEEQALDALQELYTSVEEQGTVLRFRHPGAPAVLESVLKILANDLDEEGRGDARRQAFLAGTDLVRQFCDKGSLNELHLLRADGDLQLALELDMRSVDAEKLAASVTEINELDVLAMRQRYRRAMLGEAQGSGSDGFALLDLARHAQGPLDLAMTGAEEGVVRMQLRASI